jgi:RNA polymerase sigma-70 factor, ECF subfamily
VQTTSVSLLQRIAIDGGGDDDWQRLIAMYRPFILQRIRTYEDLAEHADDITQEIMMVLMRELPVFQRQRTGSFRAWLRGITVNQLRMAARRIRRQPKATGGASTLEQQIDDLADPASQASQRWDEEHDRNVLRKIMEAIRHDFQDSTWQAFEGYVLQEKAPKTVADELGITINSVLLAKSRITRRLREEADGLVDDS